MKTFLKIVLGLVLCVALVCGALVATGVATIDQLLALMPSDSLSALQSAWTNTTQYVLKNGADLYNQLANHTPPTGDGHLLEGDLPEDHLPQAQSLYVFPQRLYPYRAMLSEDEQSAYDQIYANAMELYDQMPLHTPVSTDSIMRVMSAVFYDHPELFWLETAYQYSYTGQNSVVAVTLVFNDTADNIEASRNRFDSVVEQVVSEAKKLKTAIDKEKYVHDFLLDNVNYQLDSPLNQSAYSALVYGESVCAGYARAFQHILIELGIPTYYCAGYAGEAHAWNIVELDDGYYHVDVAWDDPLGNESGRRYYNYFNLTDEQIEEDHTRTDLSVNLPACTGTAYSYENTYGAQEDTAADIGQYTSTDLRTPEEAGLDRSGAIASLESYYDHCRQRLVGLGEGTHNFSILISNDSLLGDIFELTRSKEAMENYVHDAAEELGYAGYTANVSLQAEGLTDGYWLLTQQVQFARQQAQSSRDEERLDGSSQPDMEIVDRPERGDAPRREQDGPMADDPPPAEYGQDPTLQDDWLLWEDTGMPRLEE